MRGAMVVGGLGLLAGLLFATGLTPFGPDDSPVGLPTPPRRRGCARRSGRRRPEPTPKATTAKPPRPSPTTAAPPRNGTLRPVVSGLCLDIVAQDGVDGVPVHQVPCTGAPTQRWRLDQAGDVVVIVNTATGGCLDVTGASQDNGVPIQQWSCAPVPQQQWRVAPAGNGFSLASLISNRCLDVTGASRDQGVRMQQFDCNGRPPSSGSSGDNAQPARPAAPDPSFRHRKGLGVQRSLRARSRRAPRRWPAAPDRTRPVRPAGPVTAGPRPATTRRSGAPAAVCLADAGSIGASGARLRHRDGSFRRSADC